MGEAVHAAAPLPSDRALAYRMSEAPAMVGASEIVWTAFMADHGIPHFHNEPGVPSIKVGTKEFMCMGALPPFDHPHIFLDMGSEQEIICSYCSTLYTFAPELGPHGADPAECAVTEGAV
jgi:uncharacterized Zn-finger protein